MAYDPKDPADKKILDDAVAAALAEQAAEHEADIAGLKTKNQQLLGKLKKAEAGEGDPAEVAKLEAELETAKTELKTAQKALKTVEKERDEHKTASEREGSFAQRLLVDNGLTEALTVNGVKKEFLPAVKAMLAGKVSIKVDGENRSAVVGDKALGDFIKEWSQGDEGKNFVSAAGNGGGGANGGAKGSGAKTANRAAYDAMAPAERQAFFKDGGTLTD